MQWSIARRDAALSQEKRYWSDLDVLARAEWENSVSSSRDFFRGERPAPVMRFQSTLLVVATKTLHLYNALEQKFDQVDWFTLRRPFDVGDRMQERLIDIVTEGAVPTVIDAYQRTMAGLVGTIKQRSSEILSIVDQQYGTYVARSMNEAVLRTS